MTDALSDEAARPYDETILAVDDDDNVREIMRQTLELDGYRVLPARNGADALDVAAYHAMRIDLIVTDVRMPRMGGAQLVRTMRRWYPALRCLIVSGYANLSDALDAFGDTPTAFLAKPFAPTDFATAVRDLLDRPVSRRR